MEKDYLLVFDSIGLDTRKSDAVLFTRNPFIKEEDIVEAVSESQTLPSQYYAGSLARYSLPGLWDYNLKGFEQALFMLTYLRRYWVTPIEFCCNQYASDWMFDSLVENVKDVEQSIQQINLIKLSQLCSARLRPFGPLLLDKLGLGSKPAMKIASIMILLGIDFGLISSFMRQSIVQNVFHRIEQADSYLSGQPKLYFLQAVKLELSNVNNGDEKYSLEKLSELYRAYEDYRKFLRVVNTFDYNSNFKSYDDLDLGEEYIKYINSKSIFSFKFAEKKNTLWLRQVMLMLGKKGYLSLPEPK